MRMPPGYEEEDMILRLRRALIWAATFPATLAAGVTKTLLEIGFGRVPHEPCAFIRNGVILFFYFDDIVIAYRKERSGSAPSNDRIEEKVQAPRGRQLELVSCNSRPAGSDKKTDLAFTSLVYRQDLWSRLHERAGADSNGTRGTIPLRRIRGTKGRPKLPAEGWITDVCGRAHASRYCVRRVEIGALHDEPRIGTS